MKIYVDDLARKIMKETGETIEELTERVGVRCFVKDNKGNK